MAPSTTDARLFVSDMIRKVHSAKNRRAKRSGIRIATLPGINHRSSFTLIEECGNLIDEIVGFVEGAVNFKKSRELADLLNQTEEGRLKVTTVKGAFLKNDSLEGYDALWHESQESASSSDVERVVREMCENQTFQRAWEKKKPGLLFLSHRVGKTQKGGSLVSAGLLEFYGTTTRIVKVEHLKDHTNKSANIPIFARQKFGLQESLQSIVSGACHLVSVGSLFFDGNVDESGKHPLMNISGFAVLPASANEKLIFQMLGHFDLFG